MKNLQKNMENHALVKIFTKYHNEATSQKDIVDGAQKSVNKVMLSLINSVSSKIVIMHKKKLTLLVKFLMQKILKVSNKSFIIKMWLNMKLYSCFSEKVLRTPLIDRLFGYM